MRFEKPKICRVYQKKDEEEVKMNDVPAPPVSLPLEWQMFSQEIEAARSLKPSKRYMNEFCHKLDKRLDEEEMRKQIISEYLRETAWRRWMARGLAAAAILALVVVCEYQRQEIDSLTRRLAHSPLVAAIQESFSSHGRAIASLDINSKVCLPADACRAQ